MIDPTQKADATEAEFTEIAAKSEMTQFVEKLFADEAAAHLFIKSLFRHPDAVRALTNSFVSIYDMFNRSMQRAAAGRFLDIYQVELTTTVPESGTYLETRRVDGQIVLFGSDGSRYSDPEASVLDEITQQFDALVAALPVGTTFEELADFRAYASITPRAAESSPEVVFEDQADEPAVDDNGSLLAGTEAQGTALDAPVNYQ